MVLELVIFDLQLRHAPRVLIEAVWEGRDALATTRRGAHAPLDTPGTKP
jgi:hypothetical protein